VYGTSGWISRKQISEDETSIRLLKKKRVTRHINAGAELAKLKVGGFGKDDEGAVPGCMLRNPSLALMHRLSCRSLI
jgi:hypothetical protein